MLSFLISFTGDAKMSSTSDFNSSSPMMEERLATIVFTAADGESRFRPMELRLPEILEILMCCGVGDAEEGG